MVLQWQPLCFCASAGNDIDPANDVERGFAIFVVVGGACFYAIVIGKYAQHA